VIERIRKLLVEPPYCLRITNSEDFVYPGFLVLVELLNGVAGALLRQSDQKVARYVLKDSLPSRAQFNAHQDPG
jgi:hypothetical protein